MIKSPKDIVVVFTTTENSCILRLIARTRSQSTYDALVAEKDGYCQLDGKNIGDVLREIDGNIRERGTEKKSTRLVELLNMAPKADATFEIRGEDYLTLLNLTRRLKLGTYVVTLVF